MTIRTSRGVTLVEVIIVVVVLAVLASIAMPIFSKMAMSSRRSEAYGALANLALAQSRYRNNKPQYAGQDKLTVPSNIGPDSGLGLADVSSGGHYKIEIVEAEGSFFTAKATALSSSVQSKDKKCLVLVYKLEGEKQIYGGGASGTPLTDPNNCWKR